MATTMMVGLMEALPEELLTRILLFLGRGDSLIAAQRVCRAWRRLATAEHLWESVTLERHSWLTQRVPSGSSWREYYAQLSTCRDAHFVVLGGAYSAKGRRYSLRTGEWSDTPPLTVERRGTTLLRDNDGRLYALGGTERDRALRSVERLDPATDEWEELVSSPMDLGRCCPAAAVDPFGDIVVTGGGSSLYRHAKVYSSCTALRDDGWHPFPSLQIARCAHSLTFAVEASAFYAAGGCECPPLPRAASCASPPATRRSSPCLPARTRTQRRAASSRRALVLTLCDPRG